MREVWGEVIAMYGDTPVDVQHVGRDEPRLRPSWWICGGGLLLLAGAAGFLVDVQQDWQAHALAVETAQARGDVRPPTPGLGGLGLALALLGVVPLTIGAVRLGDRPLRSYTVGEAHHASFHAPPLGLPGPAFPLLAVEDRPVLRFTSATRGDLWIGATHHPLGSRLADATGPDGAHRVALAPGARARIEHGAVTFWISAVAAETTVVARGRLDGPTWFYSGSAGVVFGGLLALAHLVPAHSELVDFEHDPQARDYIGYLSRREVPPRGDALESGGGQAVERPGAAGEPRRARKPADARRGSTADRSAPAPGRIASTLGRDYDPERAARGAGVLALMTDDAALAPSGSGAFAAGGDAVWSGPSGAQIGERDGVGGLGLVGTGRGGALHGEGVLGLDNVGLIGKGCGGCNGRGDGHERRASAGFGGRGVRLPKVWLFNADVQGALDSDIIRRVVRAHLNEVRHCYDRALVRDRELRGRVVVSFVIGGTGKVSSATVGESDLRDAELGACVAQAVRRWSFPRPEGGGSVVVGYPFVFAPV